MEEISAHDTSSFSRVVQMMIGAPRALLYIKKSSIMTMQVIVHHVGTEVELDLLIVHIDASTAARFPQLFFILSEMIYTVELLPHHGKRHLFQLAIGVRILTITNDKSIIDNNQLAPTLVIPGGATNFHRNRTFQIGNDNIRGIHHFNRTCAVIAVFTTLVIPASPGHTRTPADVVVAHGKVIHGVNTDAQITSQTLLVQNHRVSSTKLFKAINFRHFTITEGTSAILGNNSVAISTVMNLNFETDGFADLTDRSNGFTSRIHLHGLSINSATFGNYNRLTVVNVFCQKASFNHQRSERVASAKINVQRIDRIHVSVSESSHN